MRVSEDLMAAQFTDDLVRAGVKVVMTMTEVATRRNDERRDERRERNGAQEHHKVKMVHVDFSHTK
jgi:hypothetical protein